MDSGVRKISKFVFLIFLIALFSCSKKENEAMIDMVLIPSGEFIMGSNEGAVDEGPERNIYLQSFFIDKYAVTNEQYKNYIEETKHPLPKGWAFTGYDSNFRDHPVVFVNYSDAEAYCTRQGKRLLNEEEWEKAARGTDGRKYPWGDHFDETNANTSLGEIVGTVPVTSYESGKSPYGLLNMAGNVWEWTSTAGQNEGTKITRGGSWGLSHRFSRTFSRAGYNAKAELNNIGFRCAKD